MSSVTVPDYAAEILARTIKPEQGDMSVEAARSILDFRLPPEDCARVDGLAAKARQGALGQEERLELDEYERVTALLELMQSKARLSLKQVGLSA